MSAASVGTSVKPMHVSGPLEPTVTPGAGRHPVIWEQIGPYGASVLTLVARDLNTLFAGTSSGVYKSVDGGQSWQPRNLGLGTRSVSTLIISGRNKDILLAGTLGGGLYRSDNGGDSWQSWRRGLESPASYVTELVASDDGRTIYFGASGDGVYRSANWGEDWQLASSGLDRQADISALTLGGSNDQMLWLGTSDGELFQSIDGGNSWSKKGLDVGALSFTALTLGDTQGQVIFAGTDKGVYRSSDGGENWQALHAGGLGSPIERVHILVNQDGRIWIGGEGGICVSENEGATWQRKNRGLPEEALVVTVLTLVGDRLYAGTSGYGVFVSNDGGESWDERNRGLVGSSLFVRTLLLTGQKPTTLYAGTQGAGVFKSTDRGDTWIPVNRGLSDPSIRALAIAGREEQVLYAATWDGVFCLQDDEAQWERAGLAGMRVQELAIPDAQRDTLIAGTWGKGIFRSTDRGMTWEAVNEGLGHPYISMIAIDRDYPDLVYAGTWGEGVFISRDGARTWQQMEEAQIDSRVHGLASGRSGDLYVATTTTLSKRSVTGKWSHLLLGEYNFVVIDPTDPQIMFAGGAAGRLVFTQDGGETRNEFSPINADVTDLAVDPQEKGLLFVATSGSSILRGRADLPGLPAPWWPPRIAHRFGILLGGLIVILLLFCAVFLYKGLVWHTVVSKRVAKRKYRAKLRRILVQRFDEGELRTLCFELEINYEDLPGAGRANKARELVAYLDRRRRISDLIRTGKELRPDILWDDVVEICEEAAPDFQSTPSG
jgi:photosystem II stability/assembly factor-like uncharacterized protein